LAVSAWSGPTRRAYALPTLRSCGRSRVGIKEERGREEETGEGREKEAAHS